MQLKSDDQERSLRCFWLPNASLCYLRCTMHHFVILRSPMYQQPVHTSAYEVTSSVRRLSAPRSQQDHTNAASLSFIRQVALIDATLDGRCSPVVEIVMQLAITGTKFQLLEEEGVVL
jgi:hypothetical protein